MITLRDIKVGDTIEWELTLDPNRGSYKTRRGVVMEKRRLNLRVDIDGSEDWLYWTQLKHDNPRIVKGTIEAAMREK